VATRSENNDRAEQTQQQLKEALSECRERLKQVEAMLRRSRQDNQPKD